MKHSERIIIALVCMTVTGAYLLVIGLAASPGGKLISLAGASILTAAALWAYEDILKPLKDLPGDDNG